MTGRTHVSGPFQPVPTPGSHRNQTLKTTTRMIASTKLGVAMPIRETAVAK
jgi:hypothetical protein